MGQPVQMTPVQDATYYPPVKN